MRKLYQLTVPGFLSSDCEVRIGHPLHDTYIPQRERAFIPSPTTRVIPASGDAVVWPVGTDVFMVKVILPNLTARRVRASEHK
jgi:hypothetical protein